MYELLWTCGSVFPKRRVGTQSGSQITMAICKSFFPNWKKSFFYFTSKWSITDHCCDVLYTLRALPHCFYVLIFQFNFTTDVHDEVVRILTWHSENVNMAVMYFYDTLNALHICFKVMVCQISVSSLQNLILLWKTTLIFGPWGNIKFLFFWSQADKVWEPLLEGKICIWVLLPEFLELILKTVEATGHGTAAVTIGQSSGGTRSSQ